MPELPRLNPAIRALESGKPAFVTFSPAEVGAAQSIAAAPYDAVVFEMEHNPYDIRQLRDCMQYMLDRAAKSSNPAPCSAGGSADGACIPPNGGGDEPVYLSAKQVLDIGVYGIAHGRMSRPSTRRAWRWCRPTATPGRGSAAYYQAAGQRGDAPRTAAFYWNIDQQTYYWRAWHLAGEPRRRRCCSSIMLPGNLRTIAQLQMLKEVPGIGVNAAWRRQTVCSGRGLCRWQYEHL